MKNYENIIKLITFLSAILVPVVSICLNPNFNYLSNFSNAISGIPILLLFPFSRKIILKFINFTKKYPITYLILFFVMGILPSIINTFIGGKPFFSMFVTSPHHMLNNIFVIPFAAFIWYKFISKNDNNVTIINENSRAYILVCIYSLSTIYLLTHWSIFTQNHWLDLSLVLNILYNIISLGFILFCVLTSLLNIIFSIKDGKQIKSTPCFPLITLAVFIVVWGLMNFYQTYNPIEPTYVISIVFYSITGIIFSGLLILINRKNNIKFIKDIVLILSSVCTLWIYYMIGLIVKSNFIYNEPISRANIPMMIISFTITIALAISMVIFILNDKNIEK